MPKIKTHSGAKKRFRTTKTGKIKRARAYRNHQLNNSIKGPGRKRKLRRGTYADKTNAKVIKLLIPYK